MLCRGRRVLNMKALVFLAVFCLIGSHAVFAKIARRDYQLALELAEQGQYNEAIALLKTSLDADPNQAFVYNLIGLIYLKQNESIQSAIGSFEQALRIDPNFAEAYFNLASTYAGAGNRPKLAVEYFKKTLEVDPRFVKAYFGLGWFTLTTLEEPEKAAEYFQKAIDAFPDFPEAYYGLGLSYIQMRKAPLALQSVSRIRALGREDLAAYLESVLRGGKVPEALREEVNSKPALGNAAQEPPASAVSSLSPESSKAYSPGTISSETSAGGNPPENSNPFQLN